MSILSAEEEKQLLAKAGDYDYIRFTWPDFNGIPRGKMIPRRHIAQFVKNGITEYPGTLCMGPRTELSHLPQINELGYGNSKFMPATKIYDLPWSCDGEFKVGHVICEAFWSDGRPLSQVPRTVARRQFEKLDAMGFKLFSGFEAEFFVVNANTLEPVTEGVDYCTDLVVAKNLSWLLNMEKKLHACGIDIETIHAEYSPGQMECTMAAKYGIETADDMYIFKQASKEILWQYGLKPSFMTRPYSTSGGSSGFHLNHSLWDKNGKCVFYDPSAPDNMSDTMRYWLGGIMKHIKAVLVLSSPTPNCFRRLHRPWAPHKEEWGIDNRCASIRLKTESESCCLIESRLPSSACNPYLATAATIAAGIDGIEKRIEPPPEGLRESSPVLPSIQECLSALEDDKDFVESIGSEFVDWYLKAKRANEISQFGNITMVETPPEEEMEKERKEYFDFI